jgi:hypothetical protein
MSLFYRKHNGLDALDEDVCIICDILLFVFCLLLLVFWFMVCYRAWCINAGANSIEVVSVVIFFYLTVRYARKIVSYYFSK